VKSNLIAEQSVSLIWPSNPNLDEGRSSPATESDLADDTEFCGTAP
jgi:hypothetical protein